MLASRGDSERLKTQGLLRIFKSILKLDSMQNTIVFCPKCRSNTVVHKFEVNVYWTNVRCLILLKDSSNDDILKHVRNYKSDIILQFRETNKYIIYKLDKLTFDIIFS